MDLKIKNYNAIFHTRSAPNDFTRKRLQNFANFFSQKKKTLSQEKKNHKNKKFFHSFVFTK